MIADEEDTVEGVIYPGPTMLESHSESDLTARIQKIAAEVLAAVVVPDDHLIGARVEQSPSRGVGLASCLKLCELSSRPGTADP